MGVIAAAGVAAAGTVAAAGISAYSADQASKKAAGAANARGKNAKKASSQYPAYDPEAVAATGRQIAMQNFTDAPTFDPTFRPVSNRNIDPIIGSGDYIDNLPRLKQISAEVTQANAAQREALSPGSGQQFSLANHVLNSYMKGEIPQDVIDSITRSVAEKTGGGFRAGLGGSSQQESTFARNLGKTSLDLAQFAISAAPTWQQLANSFVYSTQEAGRDSQAYSANRYRYDALNAGIDQFNSSGDYQAQKDAYASDLAAWNGENNLIESGMQLANNQYQRNVDALQYGGIQANQTAAFDTARASQGNIDAGGWAQMAGQLGSSAAKAYGAYAASQPQSQVTYAGDGYTSTSQAPASVKSRYGW